MSRSIIFVALVLLVAQVAAIQHTLSPADELASAGTHNAHQLEPEFTSLLEMASNELIKSDATLNKAAALAQTQTDAQAQATQSPWTVPQPTKRNAVHYTPEDIVNIIHTQESFEQPQYNTPKFDKPVGHYSADASLAYKLNNKYADGVTVQNPVNPAIGDANTLLLVDDLKFVQAEVARKQGLLEESIANVDKARFKNAFLLQKVKELTEQENKLKAAIQSVSKSFATFDVSKFFAARGLSMDASGNLSAAAPAAAPAASSTGAAAPATAAK